MNHLESFRLSQSLSISKTDHLLRVFSFICVSEIQILPSEHEKAKKIRSIKSEDIGSLVKVRGIVTRITEVRPFVQVATYICAQCGNEIYQPVKFHVWLYSRYLYFLGPFLRSDPKRNCFSLQVEKSNIFTQKSNNFNRVFLNWNFVSFSFVRANES